MTRLQPQGSLQQQSYLRLRCAGYTRAEACETSGIPQREADLIDREMAAPPVPHLFDLMGARVVPASAFFLRGDAGGEARA